MKYRALACDYDGTLAHDGIITATTLAALDRLRGSGRHLFMVTGRELPDLKQVCPVLDRFEWVVAENGALLHRPADDSSRLLTELLTPGALFPPDRTVVVATHHLPEDGLCPRLNLSACE